MDRITRRDLLIEQGIAPATVHALTARGHEIVAGVTGYERSLFGRGQIIRRDADGTLVAGSDRRADGRAAGT